MSALQDLQDNMRAGDRLRIVGSGTRHGFLPDWNGATLDVSGLSGVVAHDVDDQVVEVWAGTPLSELQEALLAHGQCLPFAQDADLPMIVRGDSGTVGGLLAMGLPHALSAQCGGPRDWTLGMTVILTDGTLAKSGSKAVKSVAGYDAHKLFIGSRGALGVIAKVVLRTHPVKALPTHKVACIEPCHAAACTIVRTVRTEFESLCQRQNGVVAHDPESSTLWTTEQPELPNEGWVVSPGGTRWCSQPATKYESRALAVFDPHGRLAPAWSD